VTTALAIRVALAEHAHDRTAMQRLVQRPEVERLRRVPEERLHLATAVTRTLGLGAARADLDAVCADATVAPSSKTHVDACSFAGLAGLAGGREQALTGAASAELDLLPKLPLPIVMVSVDGLPPAPFIVDSGAAGLALSKSYCDAHGIRYLASAARVSRDAAGGDVPLYPAMLDTLDAGGLRVENVQSVVIALPPNLRVGGILGPHHAFAGALVELDLRADKLRVHRGEADDDWARGVGEPVHRAPLVWDDGNILVRATLDGRVTGLLNFDTGATGSIVTLEVARQLGHVVDRAQATESVSITRHASFPPFDALVQLADGGAEEASLTPIERRQPEADASAVERLGNVGVPWMRGRRIAISADGRTLLYTDRKTADPAPAAAPSPPPGPVGSQGAIDASAARRSSEAAARAP
jgi:predicted aspartyl protease